MVGAACGRIADEPSGGRGGESLRSILPAALVFFGLLGVVGVVANLFVAAMLSALVYSGLGAVTALAGGLAISSELDRFRAGHGGDSWIRATGLAALAAFVSEPLNWLIGLLPVFVRPPHPQLVHLDSLISGFLTFVLWILVHMSIRAGDRAVAQERGIAAAREAMIRLETDALLLSLDPAVLLDALRRIGERLTSGAAKTAAETVIALAEHMRGTLSNGRPAELAGDHPEVLEDREGSGFDEARGRRLLRLWTLFIFLALEAAVLVMAASSPREMFDYYLHLTPQPLLCAAWCLAMEAVLVRAGQRSLKRAYVEAAVLSGAGVVLSVLGLLVATAAMGAFRRRFFLSGIPTVEVFYVAPMFAGWAATWFILDARQREIARLRAVAEIREAALKARNAVLRQQINPHFLFNALNALYALILGGEQAEALGVIAAIRRFVERAGGHGEDDFVALAGELATQDAYLDIERVRFGDRLQVVRRVSAGLEGAKVPHLILQPLVENAIKYGVARTHEPVRVEIAAERAGEELVLTVRDSGAPEAASRPSGLGVGLKNVEGRLRGLYGEAGRLVCGPLSPSGFLAEVRLPLVL